MSKKVENTYLQEALEDQAEVGRKLRRQAVAPAVAHVSSVPQSQNLAAAPSRGRQASAPAKPVANDANVSSTNHGRAIAYRIVGFWWWKSVIVPPNAYVVHTRKGHAKPIHLGMGVSFRFNPLSDAFLIIPSAVQTILINARCICRERQGILVQAYVQWIIDDLETAYWKLDFSDPDDPMGIVNVQLREQAEAAIKDKVATLSIDEVLADKQPIIEELTFRLRTVAEGSAEAGETQGGLGLKIVTVQIKEAIVSSAELWENLQAPFRAERDKLARLAEIENTQELQSRDRANKLTSEMADLEVTQQLEQLQATQAQERYNRESAERIRRQQLEEAAQQQAIAAEKATAQVRNESELELKLQALALEQRRLTAEMTKMQQQMELDAIAAQQERATVAQELEIKTLRHQQQVTAATANLNIERQQREIENTHTEAALRSQLIQNLPQIAKHLPQPEQQNTTIISTDGQETAANSLLSLVSSLLTLTKGIRSQGNGPDVSELDNILQE